MNVSSVLVCDNSLQILKKNVGALVLYHFAMFVISDVKTGVFVELPESCHQIMVEVMKCAYQKQPAPEKILERVELICRLPQVKKETAHRLVEGLLCKYVRY